MQVIETVGRWLGRLGGGGGGGGGGGEASAVAPTGMRVHVEASEGADQEAPHNVPMAAHAEADGAAKSDDTGVSVAATCGALRWTVARFTIIVATMTVTLRAPRKSFGAVSVRARCSAPSF